MDKTQFTMLGMTGSGKTCYLLGMYKKMLSGMKGFSLTTDNDTDVDLRNRYDNMSDSSLGKNRFPSPTNQIETFEFTLEHAFSPMMSFEWIDYPGGLLDKKGTLDMEQYASLDENVENSHSLFICVDGELLQGDIDNEDKIEQVQENCSSLINPFLSRYLKKHKYLPPTAIVVTKSDLCREDTNDDDLREIIEEAFNPLFIKGADSNRFISIIPVSIGASISENNYKGKLAPKQLQLPIFMGVWFALFFNLLDIRKRITEKESDMNAKIRDRDDEANSFFLWRDDDKVKKLERQLLNINQELANEYSQYNKALRDGDMLLEDLNKKIKLNFFNGEKYESFNDAAMKYIKTRR